MKTAIVVLNYGGTALLARALPSLVEAARAARHPTIVHVLDNDNSEPNETWARANFPGVTWARAPRNLVLCSFNAYLAAIDAEAAILLNNDVAAEPGFVDPLIDVLASREDAFLVAPRILSEDGGTVQAGPTRARLRWGTYFSEGRWADPEIPATTFSSGMGAVRRDRFLALGGYDGLFLPGICEDGDLGWRSWRAGWRSYYAPGSRLRHIGQASFHAAYGSRRTEVIAWRNGFLLLWKNLRDPLLWAQHLALAPARVGADLLRLRTAPIKGFLRALARLPAALHGRASAEPRQTRLADRGIFATAGDPVKAPV
ncbi:MAG: glycosyltransferase family 2 protein [Planctomycetes bacterium]|nr:glycosyltransferase family 2 protein [Planctomycetota bacterium]